MKKVFTSKYFVPIALFGLLITLGHASQIQKIPRQRIAVPPLPDLTVSISGCPDKAFINQRLDKLRVTITNNGRADALNFNVNLVLSKISGSQKTVKPADLMQRISRAPGTRAHINKLARGASFVVSFPEPFRIPEDTVLGSYVLGAIVDPANNVKESKEDNNSDSCQIKVWVELTRADQVYEDYPPHLCLMISGKGFEDRGHKPNIKVRLGNYEVTQTGGNDAIIYGHPPQDIPAGRSYWCYITDMQGTPVSNRVKVLWCFVMKAGSPTSGTWDTVVDIFGFNFGTQSTGKHIYFHEKYTPSTVQPQGQGWAKVKLWTNDMIKIEVPEVPAGRYYIHILDENWKKVSCTRSVLFHVH